jgi:hypothetical protein
MVWIGIFLVLLAVAEILQSVQKVELPFPVYLVLGAALAVISNYNSQRLPWQNAITKVSIQEIKEPQNAIAGIQEVRALPPAQDDGNKS